MSLKQLVLVGLSVLPVSWAFAADQLPGDKYFVINEVQQSPLMTVAYSSPSEETAEMDLLSWNEFKTSPPKPKEKYDRKKHFGIWLDLLDDNTCFTTRGLVLVRDSKVPVRTKVDKPCRVISGEWFDPYTDQVYVKAWHVEVDHVVPLKNAYISGADKWSWKRRCAYFNYMGNKFHLMPIETVTNREKSDRSVEEWTPPNKKYQCQYVANWLKIKAIWSLRMSENEVNGINNVIKTHNCDPKMFQMKAAELAEQRQLIQEVANSCPGTPPAGETADI